MAPKILPDDVVNKQWLLAQIESMNAQMRQIQLVDIGNKNAMGICYDTGYINGLLELKTIIETKETKQDLEDYDGDDEDIDG